MQRLENGVISKGQQVFPYRIPESRDHIVRRQTLGIIDQILGCHSRKVPTRVGQYGGLRAERISKAFIPIERLIDSCQEFGPGSQITEDHLRQGVESRQIRIVLIESRNDRRVSMFS